MVKKEDLQHLKILGKGKEILLDEKRITHVKDYKVEKSPVLEGAAELMIKILVRYP